MHYVHHNNTFSAYRLGTALPDGSMPSAAYVLAMSQEDRAAKGIWLHDDIAPAAEPPEGKRRVGSPSVELVEGVPTYVYDMEDIPVPSLSERKEAALATLADKRWQVETGGITVNGTPIRTDEVGQAKLTGAIALFDNDPELTTVDWEAQPGLWATLDEATIRAVGVAVGRHIQACFSRARTISEAIQSASDDAALDLAIAEIETGWPGQE